MVTFLLVLAVVALVWVTIGHVAVICYAFELLDEVGLKLNFIEKVRHTLAVLFAWPVSNMMGASCISEFTKEFVPDIVNEDEEVEEV